jgi:hypothetical protein
MALFLKGLSESSQLFAHILDWCNVSKAESGRVVTMNGQFKGKLVRIALCTVIALLAVAAGLLWFGQPEMPSEERQAIWAITVTIGVVIALCLRELRQLR